MPLSLKPEQREGPSGKDETPTAVGSLVLLRVAAIGAGILVLVGVVVVAVIRVAG
jgi:hypothetical protein